MIYALLIIAIVGMLAILALYREEVEDLQRDNRLLREELSELRMGGYERAARGPFGYPTQKNHGINEVIA